MKVYYEGLTPNHLMERIWEHKLKDVAQMEVGPEFWSALHTAVEEMNEIVRKDPFAMIEMGRSITGFKAMVTNSAININPLFGEVK